MKEKIDFVIPWVDGNDPQWRMERETYSHKTLENVDNKEHRYRDMENLQYWFRGVEKYAPWVNNIYFITYGHLPSWLNVSHPKLRIVKHSDYIPKEFLPTFSANPIELNIHRIENLENQFVYFNDDTFIINDLKEEDFFIDGKPCDSAILNVHCYDFEQMFILTPFIDIGVINKHFNIKKVLKENHSKWFSFKYGKYLLLNLILQYCPRFPGMLQKHLPNAFLKDTFKEVWAKEETLLSNTCRNKFRHVLDVNQWLMKEWQLVSGNFAPRKVNIGTSMYMKDYERVCDHILKSKEKFICVNDSSMSEEEFNKTKTHINSILYKKFPTKSLYEI